MVDFHFQHGGIIARRVPLAFLIENSFPDIRDDEQLEGAPKWVFEQRFDVDAKPKAADIDSAKTEARLRLLLEDRFQLRARLQEKTIDGYALTIGKKGARFLDSKLPEGKQGGRLETRAPGHLAGSSVSMPLLATLLSKAPGYPVVNRTELAGFYKIDLSWVPDAHDGADASPELGVSLFTAVQEQLGLRLVKEKQTGVALVIDQVAKPSEN